MSCLDLPEVVIQFGCPTKQASSQTFGSSLTLNQVPIKQDDLQVCVSKCPNYTWTPDEGDNEVSRGKMICEGGLSAAHADYKSKVNMIFQPDFQDCEVFNYA